MNPSSTGWIHKFINSFDQESLLQSHKSSLEFYEGLRSVGFIYGVSIETVLDKPIGDLKFTQEEYTKVNLFHAFAHCYFSQYPKRNYEEFIDSLISFYKTIERGKRKWLQRLKFSKKPSENLELILSARLHERNTVLKTDAAQLITYALLFVDVLAFQHFISHKEGLKNYLDAMEDTIISSSLLALQAKKTKNKYDLLVIDMVAASLEGDLPKHGLIKESFNPLTPLEKQFILDLSCLAVWDDKELDNREANYLISLTKALELSTERLKSSTETLFSFTEKNTEKILLFQYTHPVKQFYKQATETVQLLILRNKKRLLKEITESGELVVLLTQSAQRELSKEEKAKMKDQLLDIFKSIPSLAIFILPGGAILLPLFVKLIPKLLPSAFHENRVDKD